MRWSRRHGEHGQPKHAAPPRHDDEPDTEATPGVEPLVWEGRLPTVTAPPVRIAARRAADLAAETKPAPGSGSHATPDAA